MTSSSDPHGQTWILAVLLVLLAIGLYGNTLGHQWAFDDPLVYTENPAVQDGLSGIPELLGSDAYAHLYERMGREQELSGGRYRPLSLVTFALEVQFLGGDPRVAHGGNVVLYAISCAFLFLLFRRMGIGRIVPGGDLWPFLGALAFAVHPVHSEVVANVKGRDEILSLIFVMATLWFALGPAPVDSAAADGRDRSSHQGPVGSAIAGVVTSFLALLAKEYAVLLLVLVPIARFVFRGDTPLRSLRAALPVALALVVYIPLRVAAVGVAQVQAVDLLNDPYLLASPEQEWATKFYVLLRYLGLLFWPHPLACDYGYREIAYRTFARPDVWLAIVAHVLLVGICLHGVIRRRWYGFAVAFYLAHLALVSNLLVEIGTTLGERLLYHGSLSYATAVAGICAAVATRSGQLRGRGALAGTSNSSGIARVTVLLALLPVLLIHSFLTLDRNSDWYDDETLFIHDVEVVPLSARVQVNAGRAYLVRAGAEGIPDSKREDLVRTAITHFKEGLAIDPDIVAGYLGLGAAFDRQGDYEQMESAWNEARVRFPDHPLFATYDPILADRLSREALAAAQAGDGVAASAFLERAVGYQPEDGRLWFYLGRLRGALGDSTGAAEASQRATRLGFVPGD